VRAARDEMRASASPSGAASPPAEEDGGSRDEATPPALLAQD